MNDKASFFIKTAKNYLINYYGLPRAAWQNIIVYYINNIAYGITFFLPLYFTKNLHLDIAAVGLLISTYGIGKMVGGVIGGKLTDRYPLYRLSAISLSLKALSFFLLLTTHSYLLLILNLFILGFCEYTFTVTNNIWILNDCDSDEHEKLKTVSLIHVVLNLGIATSSLVVGALSTHGFNPVFIAGSLLSLCSLSYLSFISLRKQKFSSRPVKSNLVSSDNKQAGSNKKIISYILLCLFLGSIIVSQIGSTYVVFINEKFPSMGLQGVSFLFVLNPLIIILFQTPLINACKNFNKISMAGIGAFLMGINMLLLNFSSVFCMAIVTCIFYTFGEMLFFSTIPYICYEQSDAKKKGSGLGLYQMVYAASSILGPLVGGFISHKLGMEVLWYLCGILGSSCLILCCICNRVYSKPYGSPSYIPDEV